MMKKYKFIKMALLICIFGLTMSCSDEKTRSTVVKTDKIDADMQITAHSDDSVDVVVSLEKEALDIELVGNDRLVAFAKEDKKTLKKAGRDYETTFPKLDGGTEIKISLFRTGYADAEDSEVTLPEEFDITEPANNTTITEEESPITFKWSSSDKSDGLWLEATSECQKSLPNGGSETVEDIDTRFDLVDIDKDGTVDYSLKDLLDEEKPKETYDLGCNRITVTMIRENYGTLDKEYRSGDISARQERTVQLTYKP